MEYVLVSYSRHCRHISHGIGMLDLLLASKNTEFEVDTAERMSTVCRLRPAEDAVRLIQEHAQGQRA